MTRTLTPRLVVFALTLILARQAVACSCNRSGACNLYGSAEAIFLGTALSEDSRTGLVRFHVEEAFRGVAGELIEVHHYNPIQCDSFAFHVGRRYLVVARMQRVYRHTLRERARDILGSWFPSWQRPKELSVGLCNQSVPAELAAGDIQVLRARAAGRRLPSVYGVVAFEDGRPGAKVPVVVHDDHGRERRTLSAGDGRFEFFDLPTAFEEVTATLPDGRKASGHAHGTNQSCRRAYVLPRY